MIVYGAKGSGKTTVSNSLSEYLGGIPTIVLADVWKDLLENTEATQADFVDSFVELISQPKYSDGFIIDGLECLPEPAETDKFVQQCMKIKNVDLDFANNPFMTFPHQQLTAAGQAMAYVLAALDGHYVFFVGLQASEEVLNRRDEVLQAQAERRRRKQKNQEKKALMQMSEEQYQELCEEEQEETDAKRTKIRNKVVLSALEALEEAMSKKGRHCAQTASKSAKKLVKRPKTEERNLSSRGRSLTPTKQSPRSSPRSRQRRLRSLSMTRAHPIVKSICRFMFTIGNIAERAREGGEYFQTIDPIKLLHESTTVSQVSLLSRREEESLTEEEKIQRRTATPMPLSGRLQQEVQTVFTNENAIIIRCDCKATRGQF